MNHNENPLYYLYILHIIYPIVPKGPSTQDLRTLAPKAMEGMVFGIRVLKYWVLGPSGYSFGLPSDLG